jgi:hypothetical protein
MPRGILKLIGFLLLVAGEGARAQAPLNDQLERSLPFAPGATLTIDSYRGAVVIEEADTTEARIVLDLEINGSDAKDIEHERKNLSFEAVPDNGGVAVRIRHARSRVRFSWERGGEVDIYLRVILPRKANVDARVTDGSVTVGNFDGRVRAVVDSGKVFVRRVTGPVEAQVRQGDVIVSRVLGDLKVRVGTGLVRTGTIGGTADLKNGNGDVELMLAYGPVEAHATVGNVFVGFPDEVRHPATVSADGGNIRATIDVTANCEVVASARWGRVTSALKTEPVEGKSGGRQLRVKLNAGGPRLELRADGGNVRLEPGETLFEIDPTVAQTPAPAGGR